MSGPKLRFLTLGEKIDVINMKESNPSLGLRKLGEEFKCSKNQISNIRNNKNEIRKAFEEFKDQSRKKSKSPKSLSLFHLSLSQKPSLGPKGLCTFNNLNCFVANEAFTIFTIN